MPPLRLPAAEPASLRAAASALRRGALVVLPTDTVYGLAAWPWQEEAVRRVYTAKGRAAGKALPILVGEQGHLSRVAASLPPWARRMARAFWPGPLTLVVPKHARLAQAVSPFPTVGVRMPAHPAALTLLRLTGPLAVTSANRSGRPPARTADEALAQLGDAVAVVLDAGPSPGGLPSTVLDCTADPPHILRAGPLDAHALGLAPRPSPCRPSQAATAMVRKLDLQGREVFRYPARVLFAGAGSLTVAAPFALGPMTVGGLRLAPGDCLVETYYRDRWYNVLAVYTRENGRLRGWYINIAVPVRVETQGIAYRDLALDLVVLADGAQVVLDEDEFLRLPLSPKTRAAARNALRQVQARFRRCFEVPTLL